MTVVFKYLLWGGLTLFLFFLGMILLTFFLTVGGPPLLWAKFQIARRGYVAEKQIKIEKFGTFALPRGFAVEPASKLDASEDGTVMTLWYSKGTRFVRFSLGSYADMGGQRRAVHGAIFLGAKEGSAVEAANLADILFGGNFERRSPHPTRPEWEIMLRTIPDDEVKVIPGFKSLAILDKNKNLKVEINLMRKDLYSAEELLLIAEGITQSFNVR